MKRRKGKFRVIRNKGLEAADRGGKITAAEVEQIFLAGQAEEARMAEICPEFNALMELLWRRGADCLRNAKSFREVMDDPNRLLWGYLLMARGQLFDDLALRRKATLKVKRKDCDAPADHH